jgi:DNA-binding NarL/FixJ family response regulator
MEHVQMERPDLLLIEFTEDVTLEVLSELRSTAANAPVILWADSVPAEFAAQAIRLGVRDILRMSLPVELQVKCLQKVAAGRGVDEALRAVQIEFSPARQVTGFTEESSPLPLA